MTKNALIVDDSRLACKIMANMLDTMGIDSVSVYSAEEALEYIKHKQPDVLFLDHTMPGMDGLETIKLIKSNPLTATIPVLMYTAKQGEVYVGQARALGAVDVLPKGMEKDYLQKALAKLGFISPEKVEPSTVPNAIDKTVIERKSINENQLESTSEDLNWQSFWQSRIEPYLHRQKQQHAKDIKYSTQIQTVKLTREIHQTLEHFEHALVARIESNEDYKNANSQLENKQNKSIYLAVAFLLIMLQLGIFWQLNQSNNLNQQLLQAQLEQQNWKNRIEQQLSLLATSAISTEDHSTASSELATDNVTQSIKLIDDLGSIIADDLFLSDVENNEYTGITSSGYQFIVTDKGELGLPLKNQYFLTDDCTGDIFVSSANAMIYRSNDGGIWYVDKLVLPNQMIVASFLNEAGECMVSENEMLELRPLVKNYNPETGIDESLILSLSFSE